MKKVLVVAYHFPPEEGSCSEKNIRIVQLLLDNNYKVLVITKPGIYNQLIHPNLQIVRTKKIGIFHKLPSNIPNDSSKVTSINKSRSQKFFSKNIIPDGTIDWVWEVKKLYNKNKILFNDIDLILSISSPYSAHIASNYLSKRIGVPYIMSYGDPWIYEPKRKRGPLRYKIEFQLEKYLINNSSGVLLITDWNKQKYETLYSITPSKVRTFHIGYDKRNIKVFSKKREKMFSVIYGGSLDAIHRDPSPFLQALSTIDNIKVTIFNSDRADLMQLIDHYDVKDKVDVRPLISSEKFLTELYNNDALLLFGNKTPFQVPGKVFTYIATGKTIIYIKNNTFSDDGTENVLRKYGNAIIMQNTVLNIETNLKSFLIENRNPSDIVLNREQFEFHNTMSPIVEMIDSLLSEP